MFKLSDNTEHAKYTQKSEIKHFDTFLFGYNILWAQ